MDAKIFATEIMLRYHFRSDAIGLILDNCEFELLDTKSTLGGGRCIFGYGGDKTRCIFNTVQHEAAVHELAHAWWFEIETLEPSEKDDLVDSLTKGFLAEADKPLDYFPVIRRLCRVYRDGDGAWAGMWMPNHNRWNHDEIFAGLASGTMGKLYMFPQDMRTIYGQMFTDCAVFIPQAVKDA